MKKILTLSFIFCSALIFSACTPKTVSPENVSSVTPTTSEVKEKTKLSLKDLIAKNIAQKCTWKTSDSEVGEVQGELLISGKKFKQTTKMKNPNGETQYIGISDGEWFYSWSNDSTMGNMGIKIKMSETGMEDEINDNVADGKINLNEEFDYNCQPSVINESDFIPPKDIQFNDFSEMTKQFSR